MSLLKRVSGKSYTETSGAGVGFQIDGGAASNPRGNVNFVTTPGVSYAVADDAPNNRNNVTISLSGWGVLASVGGIDAFTVANTVLFTVPAGFSAQIEAVVLRCTAAVAVSAPADAGVGVSPSTSDVFAIQTLTGLVTTGLAYRFPPGGLATIAAAGSDVQLRINVAATGTSQILAADVIGRLFVP